MSPFFAMLAATLERAGHRTFRINLCVGDQLMWRKPGAINYRGRLTDWAGFVRDFMAREDVTDLVLLGEQRAHHKIAIEAAEACGVRVTATDFGYLRPDWITLEPDGMSGNSRFPKDPADIRALAAGHAPPSLERLHADSFNHQAYWEVLAHLSTYFLWFLFPFYRSFQLYNPVLNYLGTGCRLLLKTRRTKLADAVIEDTVASGKPYFVLPMQMENDFQLRAYSPFPDMVTPLDRVVGSFAHHAAADSRLIIKLHPLDPGLRRWAALIARIARRHHVENRVHFIDGGNLDKLLEGAAGVVTVNSTVGVWALRSRCPLIALGKAIYAMPGLTFQESLDRFWREAAPPETTLVQDFLTALAATIQIRGVYYQRPGLDAAVDAAARWLCDHSPTAAHNLLLRRPPAVFANVQDGRPARASKQVFSEFPA